MTTLYIPTKRIEDLKLKERNDIRENFKAKGIDKVEFGNPKFHPEFRINKAKENSDFFNYFKSLFK